MVPSFFSVLLFIFIQSSFTTHLINTCSVTGIVRLAGDVAINTGGEKSAV